jgi:hypothetical protein
MRQYDRVLEAKRNSRRTVADAINVLRKTANFNEHDHATIRVVGLKLAAVVTAPDGGEDSKIEWADGPERTRCLPSRHTQFQLKASDLTPADAGGEVLTAKGEVKPMGREAQHEYPSTWPKAQKIWFGVSMARRSP